MLDSWPGEKLAMRIWDTFEKGIGSAYRPYQIKREQRARDEARRGEMLLIAQTERDIEDIRAGRKMLDDSGRLISSGEPGASQPLAPAATEPASENPPWLDRGHLLASVRSEVVARELQRLLNLSKARIYAEEEAEGVANEEISDEPVDPDWFTRWREGAQDVSGEELQRLWGRILAGELKQPGSYTIHTLDFLRRMSKEDAETIQKLVPFVIEGVVYKIDLAKWGITYGVLLDLEDLGILAGVSGGGLTRALKSVTDERFEIALTCHRKALLATKDDPASVLNLEVYKMTRIGRELITLGKFDGNVEYLLAVGEQIKNKGYSVQICEWISIGRNQAYFFNRKNL